MKKKKIIFCLIIVLLLILIAFVIINVLNKVNGFDAPYKDLTYSATNGRACLTFYKNGKYSMYDCDSEPTSYYFDSENECTYKYYSVSKKIKFKCKHETEYKHKNYIKVLEWDNKHIKFIYEGKEKTFYSANNNY